MYHMWLPRSYRPCLFLRVHKVYIFAYTSPFQFPPQNGRPGAPSTGVVFGNFKISKWGSARHFVPYEPPSEFPLTLPFAGIVHHFRVLPHMLKLKPPLIDRSVACAKSQQSPSLRLCPCVKTGRSEPMSELPFFLSFPFKTQKIKITHVKPKSHHFIPISLQFLQFHHCEQSMFWAPP